MDDTALRTLEDRLSYLRNLEQRREVKKRHRRPGEADEELSAAIDTPPPWRRWRTCTAPKQKRRTRATVARERAWSPWPFCCWTRAGTARPGGGRPDYVDPEKGWRLWPTPSRGQRHRSGAAVGRCRHPQDSAGAAGRQGHLRSLAATEEDTVYRLYYDFDQPIAKLAGHQVLAVNRGAKRRASSPSPCCWTGSWV